MHVLCIVGLTFLVVCNSLNVNSDHKNQHYDPNWPSLMTRPLPQWFDDSKIGLFMHWGVFSVPSWGSEWYWWSLDGKKDPKYIEFHTKNYGPDFKYAEFAPMFKAKLFDPDEWAALFKKAGIKYVVLTSKHHEGWTNWCSNYSWNWNSCDNGPKRDLVGDLAKSVRAAGIHFGLYHSIFEWFHPLYLQDKANKYTTSRYVDEVYLPEAYEINKIYQPDLIWSDGDWEANSSYWKSCEFLAWLYNSSPNKDKVIVNDRWGNDNPPISSGNHHGGYFSGGDRQQANPALLKHKWENAFTLDATTWGYARNSPYKRYLNITSILYEVVSSVAYGGNVLINIGPTHDGRIMTIFQERLLEMGTWLDINGEAIYESKKWREQNDTKEHGIEHGVYYTAKSDYVYAFSLNWPKMNQLVLTQPIPSPQTVVSMLGSSKNITWRKGSGGGMIITIPPMNPTELPSLQGPWVFKLTGVA